MSEAKIREAIKVECDRQQVGQDRQELLYFAYEYLRARKSRSLRDWRLLQIAGYIEPDNGAQLRTVPVTFNNVVGGAQPQMIPQVTNAWIHWFNFELGVSSKSDFFVATVDALIKEFLDIHPFIDGNGRLAWLLRVWMLDQWDDPQPLPDYYN